MNCPLSETLNAEQTTQQPESAMTVPREFATSVGFVVSFVVAWVVIRSFLAIVAKYGLRPFGWYRIAAGLALMAYLAFA